MSQQGNMIKPPKKENLGRRGFLYTVLGGAIAALSGRIAGASPRSEPEKLAESGVRTAENRISILETKVAELEHALMKMSSPQPLAQLEGERNER